MSLKLLKQSLDILDDLGCVERKTDKANHKRVNRQKLTHTQTSTIDVTKKHKNAAVVAGKVAKHQMITNKVKKPQGGEQQESMEQNLRRLLALSQNTIKPTVAAKIIKRLRKGDSVQLEKPPVEQESIFTEEDFAAFEREYFS